MTHDWLADAQTALAGADDRVAMSEARITELLDMTIDPVPLPQQWTLDRTRLYGRALADKLARREALGLPVPLHAHGASEIAAYTPAEWRKIGDRFLSEMARYRFQDPSPDQVPAFVDPLAGPVTKRQLAELRARLPHTEDTSTSKTPNLAGRIVDRCHSGGEINYVMPVFVVLVLVVLFTVGVTAGLGTTAALFGLVSVANFRDRQRRRIELSGYDYRELERTSVAEPGPEPGTPEYQLAQIAAAIAAQITACPAWSSDGLSVHRIQLDPDAEAAQVTAHAAEISRVRATFGPAPDGDSDAALRARAQRAGDEQILATVTASLTRRVAALYRYAAELSALNTDYLALQAVERSLTASGHLETLVRQTGGDELTVRHLDRLTADAQDLHAAITTRLQVLTGDLTALHALPAGPDDHRA